MSRFTLCFAMHSFWRAGTGRGSGAILDMVTHRDADGLPCLPGRTIKGVLRDAVYRAECWEYLPKGKTETWFGTRTNVEDNPVSSLETQPGCLTISDAVLPKKLREYLHYQRKEYLSEFKQLCDGFFHSIYATSMENGIAKDQSLRSGEVVIPLNLYAKLEAPADWCSAELVKCLPLIQAIGNETSRGLGRVTVTLMQGEEYA